MPNEDTLYSAKHWALKSKEYAEQASVNNSTITITQGGTTKGSFTLNQDTDETIEIDAGGNQKTFDLFDHKWEDHLLNDQNWLRADTFSWQDGTFYTEAYNHLADDVNGLSVTYYAWETSSGNPKYVYTKSKIPVVGDSVYLKSAQNFFVVATTIVSIDDLGNDIYDISCSNSDFDAERVGDDYASENVTISGQQSTETVGSYTITYYQAQDGHKIVLPDQETTVANIYNESGVAWYYILDTANQRFKLPRENPAREELIQVVRAKGNDIALGLSDGTKETGLANIDGAAASNVGCQSSFYNAQKGYVYAEGWDTSGTGHAVGITTDSTKSGIISDMTDSTSVFKGKQYLYFYVGQFTQTATEQTAGLNSELFNGKMDRDMSNMNASQTAKETIVDWGMPSEVYENIALGPSGAQQVQHYTAPADGYAFLNSSYYGQSSAFVKMTVRPSGNQSDDSNYYATQHTFYSGWGTASLMLPVKKGADVELFYTLTWGADSFFKFIYAQGES